MSNSDMSYDQDEQQATMPNTLGTSAGRRDMMADPAGTAAEEDEEVTSDIGDVSGTTRPTDVGATDHTRAGAFDSGSKAAPGTSTDSDAGAGGADMASTPGGQGATTDSAP